MKVICSSVVFAFLIISCAPELPEAEQLLELEQVFGSNIDLQNLPNYENQDIPNYIDEDNTRGNNISNEGAMLGRILFYDKQLSSNNEVSCASCHKQSLAFGDDAALSQGVNGNTGRHSMRLVNPRFSAERRFFWDERADDLEEQTTMPIQDHIEMGFSGTNGDDDFNMLIEKLNSIDVYPTLFEYVFGSAQITEERIQESLAQFIRSIQSFDSKYDEGLRQVNNPNQNFPNFTASENRGKSLFTQPAQFQNGERVGGGLGCQGCHSAPEFAISQNRDNNGVTDMANGTGQEFDITRSPSLRNLFDIDGTLVGPMMHTGSFTSMNQVLDHYNDINATGNPNLDNRLMGGQGGNGQKLNLTNQEKEDIIAFMKSLTGQEILTNTKWSNPFLQ